MAALDGDDSLGESLGESGYKSLEESGRRVVPLDTNNGTDVVRGDLEGGAGEENGQFMAQNAEGHDDEDGSMEVPKGAKKRQKEKLPVVSFFRLFSFADTYDYVLMFLGSAAAIVHGCGIPVFLIFFGKTLNALGHGASGSVPANLVSKYALDFVYLGIAIFISSWIEVSFWMLTSERQTTRIRTKYLAALLRQDVEFFDTDTTTGDFVASIASDPLLVQQAIGEKLGNHINYMATFISGLIVAFSDAWRIALLTIAVIPLLAFGGGAYIYTMTKVTAKAASGYSKAGTIAEQAIAQVRTVYSFVSESKFIKAYGEALELTVTLGARAGLAKGLGMGFNFSIVYPSFSLLLWYGGVLVRQGSLNGGVALSAVFAVVVAGNALGQSFPNLTYFANGKVAAYKIFQIIDHDSHVNVIDKDAEELEAVEGHIELRNVDFAYPARPDVTVLKNFSLVIPPGLTVAIVGSSGSGKSTVVSLIERFYDPNAGKVLLDGHDIKKLGLKWLRGQIGLVNQEPALFATSIAKNILYGKDNATQEEIEKAAKSANAHSFIEKLPLGYQTQVGERGIQLSGGQKQRVAIARAMVRNPAVLLLDEATSALDAGSEQVVQEALDRLMVGRTTIVIAHRLSTIQNADSIAVVHQGQIIERGTHRDLISNPDGAYSGLVRLQQLAATRDNGGGKIVKEPSSSSRLGQSSRRISQGSQSSRGSRSFNAIKSISFSILRGGSTRASDKNEADEENGRFPLIETEGKSKGSFARLIKMCKPEWKYGVAGVIGSILSGCQNPAFSFILGEVLAAYYESKHKMKTNVANLAIILAAIGASSLVTASVQHYCIGVVGENLVKRVREKMLGTILRNELGWFDREENNSGQILARLHSDATNVRAALTDRAAIIVQNAALILLSWILSIVLQWQLALVIIATLPLLAMSALAQKLFLKGFSGDLNKAYARATQVAGEAVTNIRTVAAFNAEDKVQALYAEELEAPAAKAFITGQVAGFTLGISQCFMYCSYALGLWYAGQTIISDGAGFGNTVKVFLILIISANSIADTLAMTPDLIKGGEAVKSVFEVLDRETAIEPEDPEAEKADKIAGNIELKNVTFCYPSRPDVVIFKDLNLKVRAGRSLALVGASGSGKSSVIALIERFYDPIAGQILIDGKDIRNYNLRSVRQHIALVSQEPALFATSVYENILYGKGGASEAEVIEAAKAANAHKFISSLPDGYHTEVGERGVQLSGGQKQRVAIARAVLKDPAILLLDEATSALDAESEKIVQDALDRLMKGRTTIIVAHRLSTIRGADSIAVVQEGVILEEGSHTDLLAKNGGYARLVNLQNRHQQDSQSDEITRD